MTQILISEIMTFEIKTDISGRIPIIQNHLFVMVPVIILLQRKLPYKIAYFTYNREHLEHIWSI